MRTARKRKMAAAAATLRCGCALGRALFYELELAISGYIEYDSKIIYLVKV